MMKTFGKKTQSILLIILILLGGLSLLFCKFNEKPKLEIHAVYLSFSSSQENLKLKNLNYKTFVKNESKKPINFKLTFTRKSSKTYPYLESIPEKYTSKMLSLEATESEYLEIKDVYMSNVDYNTGGNYDNFEVSVNIEN